MLWFIFDLAGENALVSDFSWCPIDDLVLEEVTDDDGGLWAFHSEREATAFCNGYHACGGWAIPGSLDNVRNRLLCKANEAQST